MSKTRLRIRELREDLGLSQRDLSKLVGVGQSVLCQWEKGDKFPKSERLPALAPALCCEISDLFAPDERVMGGESCEI